jgi:hypothetical protein
MKEVLIIGTLLGVFLLSGPARAGDLVGDWEVVAGTRHGAISGTPHHGTRPTGDHFVPQDVVWTLKISSQEGNGFHGQWCSPKKCEGLVGVVRRDGSMLMVDEDSAFFATLYGEEMELCVTEPGEAFRVAACQIMKKK